MFGTPHSLCSFQDNCCMYVLERVEDVCVWRHNSKCLCACWHVCMYVCACTNNSTCLFRFIIIKYYYLNISQKIFTLPNTKSNAATISKWLTLAVLLALFRLFYFTVMVAYFFALNTTMYFASSASYFSFTF